MPSNRNLPIGIQDFEKLRKGNYLYAEERMLSRWITAL
jgi:hypothetical protein